MSELSELQNEARLALRDRRSRAAAAWAIRHEVPGWRHRHDAPGEYRILSPSTAQVAYSGLSAAQVRDVLAGVSPFAA
jgi:hypothetical protein